LLAAVGSYLDARAHGGQWFLRIENVDRTREVPGASDRILATLEQFGFEWDGPVVIQAERTPAHEAALEHLSRLGCVFDCSCSRSEITLETSPSGEEPRYPGTCRLGPRFPDRPLTTRFQVPPGPVTFTDRIQGPVSLDVAAESGDFVVRRRDGYIAYQLAVVVDDGDLGVTDVVRGADLLHSTPRQILLQEALGYPTPRYAHLPLAIDAAGAKLSKSAQSLAIDPVRAGSLLWQALRVLRQNPPDALGNASVAEIWKWAQAEWSLVPLQGIKTLAAPLP